jgi:hypothetical protein
MKTRHEYTHVRKVAAKTMFPGKKLLKRVEQLIKEDRGSKGKIPSRFLPVRSSIVFLLIYFFKKPGISLRWFLGRYL